MVFAAPAWLLSVLMMPMLVSPFPEWRLLFAALWLTAPISIFLVGAFVTQVGRGFAEQDDAFLVATVSKAVDGEVVRNTSPGG